MTNPSIIESSTTVLRLRVRPLILGWIYLLLDESLTPKNKPLLHTLIPVDHMHLSMRSTGQTEKILDMGYEAHR